MVVENLDKSISMGMTVIGGVIGWWAHVRQLEKEKKKAVEAEREKYADARLKEYAAEREFGHIKNGLEQLKQNTGFFSKEFEERLDRVESDVQQIKGGLEIIKQLCKVKVEQN